MKVSRGQCTGNKITFEYEKNFEQIYGFDLVVEENMKETYWNGFKRIDFSFEGKDAILVFPKNANSNKNWILKTEYFEDFPDFQIKMLEIGWHLAYVKNQTRWCLEEDVDRKKKFCDFLNKKYGLYEKCIPVGMSCGGLIAVKFAAKYPQCVSALYLDAPVMNFLSCPAAIGRADNTEEMLSEFFESTGITLSQLISYREHPIDKMHLILKNKLPVIMVCGDQDTVVPYHENGALLEKYYRENGGYIEVFVKRGCGHHPHGLPDNTPIVKFIEKFCL